MPGSSNNDDKIDQPQTDRQTDRPTGRQPGTASITVEQRTNARTHARPTERTHARLNDRPNERTNERTQGMARQSRSKSSKSSWLDIINHKTPNNNNGIGREGGKEGGTTDRHTHAPSIHACVTTHSAQLSALSSQLTRCEAVSESQ